MLDLVCYLQKEVDIKEGMEELRVSLDEWEKRIVGGYYEDIIYMYKIVKEQKYFKAKQKNFPRNIRNN